MSQPVQYRYADGSGNQYQLDTNTLTYSPVRPEESSSGVYSGGNGKTVELDQQRVSALTTLFENAIANTHVHQADRTMGSGVIEAIQGGSSRSFILSPNSQEKLTLEDHLKKYLE